MKTQPLSVKQADRMAYEGYLASLAGDTSAF